MQRPPLTQDQCDRAMAWFRRLSVPEQHQHYLRSGVQVPFDTWRKFGHFPVRYWVERIAK
jgi:hypothetical protein